MGQPYLCTMELSLKLFSKLVFLRNTGFVLFFFGGFVSLLHAVLAADCFESCRSSFDSSDSSTSITSITGITAVKLLFFFFFFFFCFFGSVFSGSPSNIPIPALWNISFVMTMSFKNNFFRTQMIRYNLVRVQNDFCLLTHACIRRSLVFFSNGWIGMLQPLHTRG